VTRLPLVTLAMALLSCSLMLLPAPMQEPLYFDLKAPIGIDVWGLFSGHWIHADHSHLLWNVTAFAILGSIIELHSRALLLWSLLIGTLFVDLLLISPLTDLQRYCGLSGVLNTLLGVTLCLCWRKTRSTWVLLIGALSIMKIVIELSNGQAIFTDISWPPFPLAHLAGLLATPWVIGCFSLGRMTGKYPASTTIRHRNGHLVKSEQTGSRHPGQ
jgi:rhomboid family GlyGly-CTERM serine protease